jgi:threonine/homoserine/homoserine lactone efflux protein
MPEGYVAATWSLLVTALVVMGSPGPSTLSLVAAGLAHGTRAALGYGAGLVLGTATVLLAVASGITAALLAVPALRTLLLVVAAVYLLWLAYRLATASPLGVRGARTRAPTFAGGIALGTLNPKAWVAIGVVFSGSHVAATPAVDAMVKVVLLVGVIVVVHAGWLAAGRLLVPLLQAPRTARRVNRIMAGLLVATAVLALRP